ncbi:hypothetical protein [Flavihumibacter petaseus]|uniref:Uncharacterized protein n=1 Tax=Flavihumibacter petaseus NBRC 106054 TaxID=1220578 RepID=A0A0E9N364_9BACT|nr:hypothetical protein [Flavihumibacter petaseus]GAO44111.1 hypothetical protein FPE01S_03_01500 [Flavihumibacter petaseus NBRC 106054]
MPTYGFVPDMRPRMTDTELINLCKDRQAPLDFEKHPIWVVGLRGYYLQSMGDPTRNDRGIYDDALFIITNRIFLAFNANTDPAVYKKGMPTLLPGIWTVYRLDDHRPVSGAPHYPALCQRGGPVTVERDQTGPDTGNHGINIHRGGYEKVSSVGCQTIYPDQWKEFINTVTALAQEYFGKEWKSTDIPYNLLKVG